MNRILQERAQRIDDSRLNLGCGQAPNSLGRTGARFAQERVVEVPSPALGGVCRRIKSSVLTSQFSMEHPARRQILAAPALHRIASEQLAAAIPGLVIEDRLVHAVVERALMRSLADVERIAEQMVERTPTENDTSNSSAG